MTDLNDLLPVDSSWVLREAWDINNAGVIVGVGYLDGHVRAFMMVPQGATEVGSGVEVTPSVALPDGGTTTVSVTFSEVVQGGSTTVTASEEGPSLPAGFWLPDPPLYFEVESSATASGPIDLCFTWTEGSVQNESNVHLLHYEGGNWVDVAVSVDQYANEVCGRVTSLSPFAVAEFGHRFAGFLPPLLPDGSASIKQGKQGRTIPVKFRLEPAGVPASDVVATIQVYEWFNVATGTVDTTDLTVASGQSGDSGNQFRYDDAEDLFIFNLSTKDWVAPATYQIVVTLDDGSQHDILFSLR